MTKLDKLVNRILNVPKDMRFDEVKKVLEKYGYKTEQPKGGSSHYTFRKEGCEPITIPKHSPIKRFYVKMVKEVVEGKKDE